MRRSILVVAPTLPLPADFGGAIRVFHLVRELALENDVTLVAPATCAERPLVIELGEICDVIAVPARTTSRQPPSVAKRFAQTRSIASHRSFLESSTWNAQLQAVIERVFLTRRIDLVQYEFTQTALFRPSRPCPTLIDAHNVEHELLERVAREHRSAIASHVKRQEARKVRRLEQRLWASVTSCVATSERDAHTIGRHTALPPVVVRNGVDSSAFAQPSGVGRHPHHVVFTGVMRHQPNVDGVLWYLDRVHPLVLATVRDATVTIVGADPPSSIRNRQSPTVNVTGHVDDVRPYLQHATVAIVPISSGGGTRLKVVEAFAAGTPVVSTSLGAEGLEARAGVDILIADDEREFANHVIALLKNEELASRLAESARRQATELYDWSLVTRDLVQAHERAIRSFESSSGATR